MAIDWELFTAIPDEAVWIGAPHPFDLHEVYLSFRAPVVEISRRPGQAVLYLTADSRYNLWVNGRFLSRGPGRGWPATQTIDPIDLTTFNHDGQIQIAIQVYQPGYSHFSYVHRGLAGLLAWLAVDGQVVLVSDSHWRVTRDRSFSSRVPRISIYGSGNEERRMTLAEPWFEQEFNDSRWPAARVVARPFDLPWTGYRLRQVPFLNERSLPITCLAARRGPFAHEAADDPHQALVEGWRSAAESNDLKRPAENGWLAPQLANGETALWLFDLGRDYTCQGEIEIKGAAGGEQISISYAEKMRQGEIVLSDPQTYCRVRLTDRFFLRPGDQRCRTFALRGGRYLLFQLVGLAPPGLRLRLTAVGAFYPLTITKPVETRDPMLQEIVQMCEATMHACLQDGFVDGVWRESSQWLGDALPQSRALLSMSDDVRPLRQILVQAAEGAYPDGILPSVVPGEIHSYTIVTYSMMWVELLAVYTQATADRQLLIALWPTLEKLLDGLFLFRDASGLLISPPGRRFYIDWAPLSQNQPHAVFNLHALRALQFAVRLAHQVNQRQPADRWARQADRLGQLIRRFFHHEGRWFDDLQRTTRSQLTAALAILTGAAEPDEWPTLADELIARSLNPSDEALPHEMVLASPFMHHYIFEALRHISRDQAVIDIIKVRWGRWTGQGYPTTWENWSVDFPDGSQCHAFSAHPRYHLHEIRNMRYEMGSGQIARFNS